MTTQTPRNQPKVPRAVHGPSSIPCICPAVHHQPAPASAKSTTTSPRRTRTAAKAAGRPPAAIGRACSTTVIRSGSPGEVRLRQAGLAFVGDPEGVDARTLRLGHCQVGPDRVEHPGELDRLTGFDPERDDVLDLEVDPVADADRVPQAVVVDVDRRALDAEHLSDERSQACHWTAELAA